MNRSILVTVSEINILSLTSFILTYELNADKMPIQAVNHKTNDPCLIRAFCCQEFSLNLRGD